MPLFLCSILHNLVRFKNDESPEVLTQLVLSVNLGTVSKAKAIVSEVVAKNAGRTIFSGIQNAFTKNEETKKYGAKLVDLKEPDRDMVMNGAKILQSLYVSCHVSEGIGLPTKIAPPLIGKFKLLEYKDDVIRIMLHGLKGPADHGTT